MVVSYLTGQSQLMLACLTGFTVAFQPEGPQEINPLAFYYPLR